jgi:hypothetical protein
MESKDLHSNFILILAVYLPTALLVPLFSSLAEIKEATEPDYLIPSGSSGDSSYYQSNRISSKPVRAPRPYIVVCGSDPADRRPKTLS